MSCVRCRAPTEQPMSCVLPSSVDTVIVGNGPSALILSYILHGHIPSYDRSNPHPDALLGAKLETSLDLLDLDIDSLTEHFGASRFPYSTQALPVNVLLDSLLRPNGDTEEAENKSCVTWRYAPEKAISHLVFGTSPAAGGQWAENAVPASWDIGTLSYANMLSLPGYSFREHYWKLHGQDMPSYLRPSRRTVAGYFAAYPSQVGIDDVIQCTQRISGLTRTARGFHIASHDMHCRHLVLASGTFSELIPPRPLLLPLLGLPKAPVGSDTEPLLVVGSGFSAADVIISTPAAQKIVHIFKWAPSTSPSPLRACHSQAYPEYAGVYRKMKLAASGAPLSYGRPPKTRRASSAFDISRDWTSKYEGLPNTAITDIEVEGGTALVTLQPDGESAIRRRISGLAYVIGRRGSLGYLDESLHREITNCSESSEIISGQTLRQQAFEDLQVAPDVFIIGSLTGDSLIRFSYGSCVYTAGKILNATAHSAAVNGCGPKTEASSKSASPFIRAMNGFDGHGPRAPEDLELPLDRRKDAASPP